MARRSMLIVVVSVLLLALASAPALAATWYVDSSFGSDMNDGTTPASAFKSVTRGMGAAAAGDSVSVMEGWYSGPVSGEVFPIDLKSGVALLGYGASGTTIVGNGSTAILTASGVDAAALVQGFTLQGGYPAIDCTYSSLTISDNVITGNAGGSSGAGIHSDNGALTITGNTITDNHATYGGGISCEDYDLSTITGNTISGNTASGGGGICAYYHADPSIFGNTIADNAASLGGGILSEAASLPFLSGNIVTGNTATGPGAGLMGYSASALVENCVFAGNDAGADGGGIALMNSGASQIVNCTVAYNSSGAGSAGVARYSASWPASAFITNCILWENDNPGTPGFDDLDAVFTATYSDLSDRPGDPLLHTLSVDPLFVDAAAGDFRLGEGSGCIDMADDAAAPALDLDGVERPQGDAADMGAFEYVAPEPDTTPPVISVVCPEEGVDYVVRAGTVFEFSAEDERSGVASLEATLQSGAPVDSGDLLPLRPGSYVLTIVAEDGAGNVATRVIGFTMVSRGQGGSKPGPR